ncbi:MAG: hypothetical protein IH609_04290, partial [Dehalococcoidia bacterium]|nr:hypothetical protein [Dehalococcoidia bacterium]
LLRRVRNLFPERLHQSVWLRLPADLRMKRMMNAWLARMDLTHDRAFALEGDCSVALRLNIEGRERYGVLPREEGRAFLEAIFAEAKRYKTEDGKQAFVELFVTADAFRGPRLERLPDATLIYNPEVLRTRTLTRDDGFEIQLYNPESRNGSHTGRGFAFYRFSGGTQVHRTEVDNLDFAPTVLQRLGVTPGSALQGTPFLE